MSDARKRLDWEAMFNLAIDPEKARGIVHLPNRRRKIPVPCAATLCNEKYEPDFRRREIVDIYDE